MRAKSLVAVLHKSNIGTQSRSKGFVRSSILLIRDAMKIANPRESPFPFWLFLFLRHQQTEIETRSFEHHHSLVHFAHKMQTKPLQDLLNYPQCLANKERETTLICLSIYGNGRSSSTLHSARNCQNKLNSSSIDFNLYFETLPSSSPAKHTSGN